MGGGFYIEGGGGRLEGIWNLGNGVVICTDLSA